MSLGITEEKCFKALQFGLIHKHLPLLELWAKAAMMPGAKDWLRDGSKRDQGRVA